MGKTEKLAWGSLVQAGKALPDPAASNDWGTEDGLIANSRVTMTPLWGQWPEMTLERWLARSVQEGPTSAAEKFGCYPELRELSINFKKLSVGGTWSELPFTKNIGRMWRVTWG